MTQLTFDSIWAEQNQAKQRVVGLYRAMNRIKNSAFANATQKEAVMETYEQEFARAFEAAQEVATNGSNLSAQLDALRDEYNRIRDFA